MSISGKNPTTLILDDCDFAELELRVLAATEAAPTTLTSTLKGITANPHNRFFWQPRANGSKPLDDIVPVWVFEGMLATGVPITNTPVEARNVDWSCPAIYALVHSREWQTNHGVNPGIRRQELVDVRYHDGTIQEATVVSEAGGHTRTATSWEVGMYPSAIAKWRPHTFHDDMVDCSTRAKGYRDIIASLPDDVWVEVWAYDNCSPVRRRIAKELGAKQITRQVLGDIAVRFRVLENLPEIAENVPMCLTDALKALRCFQPNQRLARALYDSLFSDMPPVSYVTKGHVENKLQGAVREGFRDPMLVRWADETRVVNRGGLSINAVPHLSLTEDSPTYNPRVILQRIIRHAP